MEIYIRRQVSKASKEAIKVIADLLCKWKWTDEGIKRQDPVIEKLFIQQKLTHLILSFYHSVFPIMKSFVELLQKIPKFISFMLNNWGSWRAFYHVFSDQRKF